VHDVEVAVVEPRLTVVVAETTTWDAFPALWPRLLDEVYAFVRPRPELGPRWHNVMLYRDDVVHVEVGVLAAAEFAGEGRVVCSSLPGGRVASTVHRGDWQLGPAHDAIHRAHGDELAGPRWEIYGHGDEEPQTEVSYLLTPRSP
jgi:effector-binding domain-containing protein